MNAAQCKSFWTEIVNKLSSTVPRAKLITWFKDTAVLGKEEGTLIVGLSLPMFLHWHLEHYKDVTLKAAQEINPSVTKVIYQVDVGLRDDRTRTVDVLTLFPEKRVRKLPGRPEIKVADGLTGKMLNPRYTLDSFVVGSSNRLAHAAAQAVASQPGGKYNPFFIYGGVGLGKTHLLQGVGNALLKNNPRATVLYTTSEEFTNQVIEAIAHRKMEILRRKYRPVDMLIVDDIQFFASKDKCQEEFFHTFNALTESGRQVVLSSDRAPAELQGVLHDRLRSRFERGMVADVRMPDFETRVAILAERSREYGILFDSKVLEFIAEHVTDSVRSLEGILMQAVAQFELEQCMPTVKSIAEIMRKLARDPYEAEEDVPGFELPSKRRPGFDDLLEGVSDYYAIPIEEMVGASRNREILIPRQIAMYLGRKYSRMSTTAIGERFSGRDHSTVIHAVRKIEKQLMRDTQLLREVRAIEREVGVVA
jgi:chromosomal replication initiator protein